MSSRVAPDQLAILHLKKEPSKPTIVFLHESLGCIELWRDFPEKLGELTGCNVFVYDRHGYGRSQPFLDPVRNNDYMETEAVILSEIIDQYQLGKTILFGHSDGGSIALIAAAKYPEKIAAVITEGAHIFVEEETLAGIRAAMHLYQTTHLKTKLEKYHGNNTEALFWAWAKTWTADAFRSWNIEHFLPAIMCPTLVIQGDGDEYGTIAQVDGIVGGISGEALKLFLPNIKHTPHKEDPDLILHYASGFILNLI